MEKKEAVFYGMISNIDENIGKLRQELNKKGIADNTIFIFMTDNGTSGGARIFNKGMRGRKGSEYEGGHRVPFFLHWPDGKLDKGIDVGHVTAHIDILPTLIELCHLKPIQGYKFDGKSLVPLLRNPQTEWPARTIITDSQRVRDPIKWRKSSTMTDRWRLINGKKLYDIKADPGQKKNLAAKYPEIVKKLRAEYETWWQDISPAFKKEARFIVGNNAENPLELTCHDWLTNGKSPPWHQGAIRNAKPGIGEWALNVEKAGKYRISLRRWPKVVNKAISEGLPPGKPVPGYTPAFRTTAGKGIKAVKAGIKIARIEKEVAVKPSAKAVTFEVTLPKGNANLTAYFLTGDNKKIGAYYAEIEKK